MPTFARARTLDRLKALEVRFAPKARALVFTCFNGEEPGARDEQLAAFKAAHVGPNDIVHSVIWMRAKRAEGRPILTLDGSTPASGQ